MPADAKKKLDIPEKEYGEEYGHFVLFDEDEAQEIQYYLPYLQDSSNPFCFEPGIDS